MKRLSKRRIETVVSYQLVFDYIGRSGGYAFPCDADGTVHVLSHVAAQHNLVACLDPTNPNRVTAPRIERHEYTDSIPAVGQCDCGALVRFEGFTNTCQRCYRDYNRSGQLLASREQWGEETGESLSNILVIR